MQTTFQITKDSLVFGFKNLKKYWKYFLAMFGISLVIELILNTPAETIFRYYMQSIETIGTQGIIALIVSGILYLLSIAANTWWTYGLYQDTLKLNEEQKPSYKHLKRITPLKALKFFATTILFNLALFALLIPVIAATVSSILFGIGELGFYQITEGLTPTFTPNIGFFISAIAAVLFVIAAIYIWTRLMFTTLYFCSDEKTNISNAFKNSWKTTKNHVGKIILYTAYVGLLYIISFVPILAALAVVEFLNLQQIAANITLGLVGFVTVIGLIVLIPTTWISYTYYFYNVIKK